MLIQLGPFALSDHFRDATKMVLTSVYTKATTLWGIVAYRNDFRCITYLNLSIKITACCSKALPCSGGLKIMRRHMFCSLTEPQQNVLDA